jgi:hypothetical protein
MHGQTEIVHWLPQLAVQQYYYGILTAYATSKFIFANFVPCSEAHFHRTDAAVRTQ